MKKNFKLFFVIFLCMFLIPSVQAKTINHFYAEAGENISFEDTVSGSSALAGQSVEVNGNVQGVNFLAANSIEHNGQSDYLVSAGNSITVSGIVNNDAIVAGNVITVDKDSILKRDVTILGSDIKVRGNLGRNVSLYGNKVSLEGATIKGNVKIYAEEILVDDDSIINGQLSYPEDAKVSIGKNITNIKKTGKINKEVTDGFTDFISDKIWSFLSLLVIFAVLTLFKPKLFDKINKDYEEFSFTKGVETFSKGLVFLIIVPIISAFLLVIPFTLPLSIIMFALYFIIIYISKVFSMYLIGYKLWQKFAKKDINILVVGMIGILTVFILELIPFISILTILFTLLIGIGMITDFIFESKK